MTTETDPRTTTHCHRCGRLLSDPKAVAAGYGRTCLRRIAENAKAAALTESPAQVAKAVELIEDEALVPVRRGVYQTVSTDGTEVYLTSATNCSCPARKGCYHSLAVAILTSRPVKPARVFALPGAPVVEQDPWWNIPASLADELAARFAA